LAQIKILLTFVLLNKTLPKRIPLQSHSQTEEFYISGTIATYILGKTVLLAVLSTSFSTMRWFVISLH